MITDILIEDADKNQQEIDTDTTATFENKIDENNPQMLEVVAKDFRGKQLIID